MYCILGCGGHARSVIDVLLQKSDITELIIVDSNAKKDEWIYGYPVLKDIPYNYESGKFFLAIGNNQERKKKYQNFQNKKYIKVISPNSYVSLYAKVEAGCLIANYSHIGPESKIGKQTIINTGVVIEHETQIGEFCHIAPGSVICGRSKIGNGVFIGAGTVVIDSIEICSNVTIGANSTVLKNITTPGIYVGSPIRRIG